MVGKYLQKVNEEGRQRLKARRYENFEDIETPRGWEDGGLEVQISKIERLMKRKIKISDADEFEQQAPEQNQEYFDVDQASVSAQMEPQTQKIDEEGDDKDKIKAQRLTQKLKMRRHNQKKYVLGQLKESGVRARLSNICSKPQNLNLIKTTICSSTTPEDSTANEKIFQEKWKEITQQDQTE